MLEEPKFCHGVTPQYCVRSTLGPPQFTDWPLMQLDFVPGIQCCLRQEENTAMALCATLSHLAMRFGSRLVPSCCREISQVRNRNELIESIGIVTNCLAPAPVTASPGPKMGMGMVYHRTQDGCCHPSHPFAAILGPPQTGNLKLPIIFVDKGTGQARQRTSARQPRKSTEQSHCCRHRPASASKQLG